MLFLTFVLVLTVGVLSSPRHPYAGMEMAEDFSPRYYLGDPRQALAKRDGSCADDAHSCGDVNFPDICCKNTHYCIVLKNSTGQHVGSCCPVERGCTTDTPCNSTAFLCQTSTVTVLDGSTSTTMADACCPRGCTDVTRFKCASEFGGGCCLFGEVCASNSQCQKTTTPTATSVDPVDPNCTTSQHRCEDDKGCCDDGKVCTTVGTDLGCVIGRPTNTDMSIVHKSSGLSDAAKAGIAVGAVIGMSGIVGGLTWFCLAKRRGRTLSYRNSGAGGDDATEVTSESRGHPARLMGVPQNDLPSPVEGPYTQNLGAFAPAQHERALPHQPHHPGDIAVPVEMAGDFTGMGFGVSSTGVVATETPSVNSAGREWLTPGGSSGQLYELYGSDTPTPQNDGQSALEHSNSSPLMPPSSADPANDRSPPT